MRSLGTHRGAAVVRVYKTKGSKAKTRRITVPMDAEMFDLVEDRARESGQDKASLVRRLIDSNLRPVEEPEPAHDR